MYRYVFFLASVLLSSSFTHSQTVLATDGAFSLGPSGSLSWTLGEIVTETFEDQSLYLTQGFQQVYLGSVGSSSLLLNKKIDIYPNPFSSLINISGEDINSTFILTIHDSQLRLIFETEFSFPSAYEPIVVPLLNLSSGIYILSIKNKNRNELFHKRIIKI